MTVVQVDHRPIGKGRMGPVTAKLRQLYFDIVRGKVKWYQHWCMPVYNEQAVPSLV
jgi:branched-chain amino acid aminotransferase